MITMNEEDDITCDECGGSGKCPWCEDGDKYCPFCFGDGQCVDCDGMGTIF